MISRKKIVSVLMIMALVLQLTGPVFMPSASAAAGSPFNGTLTLSVTGADKSVLGQESEIHIGMENNSGAMAFNVGAELVLPDGMELGSNSLGETTKEVNPNGSTTYFWQDIKDLANGETFDFPVKVKVSDNYADKVPAPFGTKLSIMVKVYASSNARQLYRDPSNPTASKGLDTEVVPFLIEMKSDSKNVKGAGANSNPPGSGDEWGVLPYTITIVNNSRYPATFTNITNVADGAVEFYGAGSATSSVEIDKRKLAWSGLQLLKSEKKELTFKTAYLNNKMSNGQENKGAVVLHGFGKDEKMRLTYAATVNGIPYNGTLETDHPVAHDIIVTKSVALKTTPNTPVETVGYGDRLIYTLVVKTNEYYEVNDVKVEDVIGDGQTFKSYVTTPDDSHIESKTEDPQKQNGTTTLNWDLGDINAKSTVTLKYEVEVDEKWTKKYPGEPIYAGDLLDNYVEVEGNTDASGKVTDSDSTTVVIKFPSIKENIQEVNDAIIVRDKPVNAIKQEVTVGDTVTFNVVYDAKELPAKQHKVRIYDYLPLGTVLLNGTTEVTNSGSVSAYVMDGIIPEYDKDLHALIWDWKEKNIDENQAAAWSVPVKVLVKDDTSHVLMDKGAKNLVVLTYQNSGSIVESKREEVELVYVEPKLKVTRVVTPATDLKGDQEVTVTITITNEGKTPAYNINYTEILPEELVGTPAVYISGPEIADQSDNKIEFKKITQLDPYDPNKPSTTVIIVYKVKVKNPVGAKRDIVIDADWEYTGQQDTTKEHRKYKKEAGYNAKSTIKAGSPKITKTVEGTSGQLVGGIHQVRPGDWIVYKLEVEVPAKTITYEPSITDTIYTNETFVDVFTSYTGNGAGTSETSSNVVQNGNSVTIKGLPTDSSTGTLTYTRYIKTTVKKLEPGSSATDQTEAVLNWKDSNTASTTAPAVAQSVTSGKPPVNIKTPNLDIKIELAEDELPVAMKKGDTKELVMTVENKGGETAYSFTPAVEIPPGFSFVGGPSGQTKEFGTNVKLAAGGKLTYPFKVQLDIVKGAGSQQTLQGTTANYYSNDGLGSNTPIKYEPSIATYNIDVTNVTIKNTVINTSTSWDPNSGTVPNIQPGDWAEYKVEVTVPAGTTAYNLKLEDTFDLDRFNVIEGPVNTTYAGNVATLLIGDVPESSSPTIKTYTFKLKAKTDEYPASPLNKDIISSAMALWDITDGKDPNRSGRDKQTTTEEAKIRVVQPSLTIQNIAPSNTKFSDTNKQIELKFRLNNSGNEGSAFNSKVEAVLPPGLKIVSGTISDSGVQSGNIETGLKITWSNLLEITSGGTKDLTFKVETDSGIISPDTSGLEVTGTLVEYASRGNDPSKKYGPNTPVTQTLTVDSVKMIIERIGTETPVRVGDEVKYKLGITVPANTTAFNAVLSKINTLTEQEIVEVLEDGTSLDTTENDQGYVLGDLTGAHEYVIVAKVKTDAGYSQDPANGNNPYASSYQAKFTYDTKKTGGSSKSIDSSKLTVNVGQPFPTILLASDKTEFADASDEVEFTMTVQNRGKTPAYNPLVKLTLPEGIHFSDVPDGVNHDSTNLTWNLNTLPVSGSDQSQDLVFKVAPDAATVVKSVYEVQYSLSEYYSMPGKKGKTYGPIESNLINVEVNGVPNWDASKTITVDAGQMAEFTNTLTNQGAGQDRFDLAVSLDASFPIELWIDNVKVADAVQENGDWTWKNIDSNYEDNGHFVIPLSAGAQQQLKVKVHVPENTPYDKDNPKLLSLSATSLISGEKSDVQDKLYVDGKPLEGWTGKQGPLDWLQPVLAPGDPIKFSAISSNHIVKVIAYYTYDSTKPQQKVELQLANPDTYVTLGEKHWVNVVTNLPDDIKTGIYNVTFEAFDELDHSVELDKPGDPNGSNNSLAVKDSLEIRIQVEDAGDHSPIEGAEATLLDVNGKEIAKEMTNVGGGYSFGTQPAGQYTIIVRHQGHADVTRTFFALPSTATDNVVEVVVELSSYSISMIANPATIVGDGRSQTQLTATVRDSAGKPVEGVTVTFTAPNDKGSFLSGGTTATAITDGNGQASVIYVSKEIEGLLSERFPVEAEAADSSRGIYAKTSVVITFQPGRIDGIVKEKDGDQFKPVAGAIVIISKDSIIVGSQVTGEDGSYSIGIPRGVDNNGDPIEYDIQITKPVNIGGTTQFVTSNYTITVGAFDSIDKSKNVYHPDKAASGLIAMKLSGGNSLFPDKVVNKLKIRLIDSNGTEIEQQLGNSGTFSVAGLAGGNYKLAVVLELEPGQEIVINADKNGNLPVVVVNGDGELAIVLELIDPFGTVTNAVTNKPIEGAHVELYYADTPNNQANIPSKIGQLVWLPEIEDFEPNQNHNPQTTDTHGNYAYMVYGFTDYYLKVSKPGYYTYKSDPIEVTDFIVQHDLKLRPVQSPIGTSGSEDSTVPSETKADLAVSLTADQTRYQEGDTIAYTIEYLNKTNTKVNNVSLEALIPQYTEIVDAAGGMVNNGTIRWSLGDLAANAAGKITYKVRVKMNALTQAEQPIDNKATISSTDELTNTEDDQSSIQVLAFTSRFGVQLHKRYILGYPDGLFKPDRAVTRAEIAAIFARIMDLKSTVKGEKIYSDVDPSFWAGGYIEAVTREGLFSGYGNNKFMPDKPITRAELASVISRYLKLQDRAPLKQQFGDLDEHWAKNSIEELFRNQIVDGYPDGSFKPDAPIIRSETVTMINRMLKRGPLTDVEPSFPDVSKTHWAFGQVEESTVTHEFTRNADGSETMTKRIDESLW